MYSKILVLFVAAFLTATTASAKIWRVNNNGAGGGDFSTAQLASSSGSVIPGDTVHLEPSPNTYGALTTNKRLVWISTGAFLGIHSGEQYSLTPAKVSSLTINSGSENSVFSIYIDGSVTILASNVRLERCYCVGGVFTQQISTIPNNDVIINCYLESYLNLNVGTNHFISNNIIGNYIGAAAGASAIIQNNVINATQTVPTTITNCTLQNNIFNKTGSAYTFPNCVVQYNMSVAGAGLPVGSFNQNNVNMATVFVNNSGLDDASFVLKAGSPAIGSGVSGADMGPYGGTTPFKLALQPAIPAIYKLTGPFTPAGSTMNIIFSTKSNN